MNTDTLAYMGDAVYELHVRERVIGSSKAGPGKLHNESVGYVRADAQAKAMKMIFDELPEELQKLVKRARNHKSSSRPKNADPVEYKWATALESLIGYLYLAGENEMLRDTIDRVFQIIEESK